MNILIDTDILIDVAIRREPFLADSLALIDRCDTGRINGFVAWHSFSNLFYITRPVLGAGNIETFIAELLRGCRIPATSTAVMRQVLTLGMKDFEDAMQVGAALACSANIIATRNVKDFRNSPVKALPPGAILDLCP